MYHQHFKLSGPPFQFTPMPGALYLSKTHREGLAALEWSLLHEPTGFTLLVGESGIGKTTLVCSILARCYANVRNAYVSSPKLDFEQMMQVILAQLFRAAAGQSRLQLSETFRQLLEDLTPGERLAIIIDEAQDLADETLEEFRLLSNLDTGAERRLQIVFVGQPELTERLAEPRMAALNDRIGSRARLTPLGPDEMLDYIDSRLRTKGGTAKKIFAAAALKHLVRHSSGIPRRANVLCHNALLFGFAAGRTRISLKMASAAVSEFEAPLAGKSSTRKQPQAAPQPKSLAQAALAVGVLVLAALGALYAWSSQSWPTWRETHATQRGEALRPQTAPVVPETERLPALPLPALETIIGG
jgi:general secretion pathway protein A